MLHTQSRKPILTSSVFSGTSSENEGEVGVSERGLTAGKQRHPRYNWKRADSSNA